MSVDVVIIKRSEELWYTIRDGYARHILQPKGSKYFYRIGTRYIKYIFVLLIHLMFALNILFIFFNSYIRPVFFKSFKIEKGKSYIYVFLVGIIVCWKQLTTSRIVRIRSQAAAKAIMVWVQGALEVGEKEILKSFFFLHWFTIQTIPWF